VVLTSSQLSPVYPLGARINEQGRLEVGGCDTVELAREFGTPAYIVAEDDLRARARSFVDAVAARHADFDVLFASKAFPCTAVYRVLAEEGLACDVASGGELALALAGGFDAARIYLHGNAKSEGELREAEIVVSHNQSYWIRGGIELEGEPRNQGASLEHYALCRCGHSKNKPFCDGSHYDANFNDPDN